LLFSYIYTYAQEENDDVRKYIDSLLTLPNDTNKVIALNDYLWKINQFDSLNSIYCAKISIAISRRIGYTYGLATAQKNLAAYYYNVGAYDEALDLYEKSLDNYLKINNKKGIAISYRNIGNINSQNGNWKLSLDYYFKSLEIREELKDTIGIAIIYNAIGLLYTNVNDNEDSALLYFSRASHIFKVINDEYNLASTYLNFSSIYYSIVKNNFDQDLLDSCIIYAKKSIKLSSKINEYKLEASAYEILGECKLLFNEYDSAFYFYKKSLDLRKQANNIFGIVNSLSKIGYYYLIIKDYYNSEINFNEALKLSEDLNIDISKSEILNGLSNLFYKTGRYKQAYDYFTKYINLRDSLEGEQNTKQMTQLTMQYEFDKQQKTKELEQSKKDAIKEAQIKRQRTITFFFIIGFVLMIVLAFVIFRSYQQNKRNNKILQDKNDQISTKNAQLNQQNEEIEAQRDEIEHQKEYLEYQNKEITSSINYARRIQRAMLTSMDFFNKMFKDFFVLYKPRDIVSGDFYWASYIADKIVVTAVDCTGHGVPGAFMSMLGISFLNQIVNQDMKNSGNVDAAEILNKIRALVIVTLGRSETEENPQEGMDMSLVVIDTKTKTVTFSGAYNPLYIIRDNEIIIIDADKMPVGYHFIKKDTPFNNKFFDYKTDDKLYLFSDGFADQFGGPGGKKFSPKQLREKLIANSNETLVQQGEIFDNIITNWINTDEKKFKQLDDILLIGLKLS